MPTCLGGLPPVPQRPRTVGLLGGSYGAALLVLLRGMPTDVLSASTVVNHLSGIAVLDGFHAQTCGTPVVWSTPRVIYFDLKKSAL